MKWLRYFALWFVPLFAWGQSNYELPCPTNTGPLVGLQTLNPVTGKYRANMCVDSLGNVFAQGPQMPREQARQWGIWLADYGTASGADTEANNTKLAVRSGLAGSTGFVFTVVGGASRTNFTDVNMVNIATGNVAARQASAMPFNDTALINLDNKPGFRTKLQLVSSAPNPIVWAGWINGTCPAQDCNGAINLNQLQPSGILGFRLFSSDTNWQCYSGNNSFSKVIDTGVARDSGVNHTFWVEYDGFFANFFIDARFVCQISSADPGWITSAGGTGNGCQPVVEVGNDASAAIRNLKVAWIYWDITSD
jgi:hypothetical protein